jgi:hypothetical protein
MRNIIELAPTSVGASRYWSSGPVPVLGAEPAAGAVGCAVDGEAGEDDGAPDDGASDDGKGDDRGDGEVFGVDEPATAGGGELEAAPGNAAADCDDW